MPNDATQDFTAKKTYLDNWTAHLGVVGRTISTATVAVTGAAVITGTSNTTTGVLFRLDTTAVSRTAPSTVYVTTTVTLDNGDIDARTYSIGVTTT